MEGISLAYFNCSSDSFGLSLVNNFAIEHENIFNFTPNKTYKSAKPAAEPAPETTNFTSSAFYLLILKRV
jgi:hypothetical protein